MFSIQPNQVVSAPPQVKKVKKPLTFPWWFKIFAYGLAFIFSGVSAFFIIIQGITFGQQKVSEWLTSLVVSVASSILLTQPIQVGSPCPSFKSFRYIKTVTHFILLDCFGHLVLRFHIQKA
jgi:hypothetical protein